MNVRHKAFIIDADEMRRAIVRISHEIVEKNRGTEEVALVGIRRRGVPIAERGARGGIRGGGGPRAARTRDNIRDFEKAEIPLGILDITLYRDDLQRVAQQPVVRTTEIPFDVDDKIVVLVDDVLFTGRTVRAALDALIDYGRPRAIQLAVLVDRGHRELPIRADYVGKNVPTSRREVVHVHLRETDGEDGVHIDEMDRDVTLA
jgi:pyrimidine operon attenuation protein/uracil phosphoribosyltransferase